MMMMCFRLSFISSRSNFFARSASLPSIVTQNSIKCDRNTLSVLFSKWPDINSQTRGFKSDLKIKWVRPAKIPCIKPEKSGDLKPIPEVNLKQFPLEFEKSNELKDANDHVKRVLSLEFMPRCKTMEVLRSGLVNDVKRHVLDNGSIEARIAAMTGGIRDMQAAMEEHGKNNKLKVRLKELIDKRKKYLKYLRTWDYKRFEWLLEKLDLVYHPPPDHFHWVTRKESLCKLTNRYCDKIKEERLAAYRECLESQKVMFLQEKAVKLQWIIEEEKACGVEPSVSQNEVDEVLKQLKELEITKGITKESENRKE